METSRFLKPGQLLWHSQYRIERVLGHGGFGITYLATDLSLGRVVAVKEFFISSLCVHNENGTVVTTGVDAKDVLTRYKDKFLKEARNIAKFNHPNIVNIISAFEDNNTAYYVMDFLDKGSLSDMVKATGPVSVNSAISMLEPIAGALDVIHTMKMNHLDIKPGNIMLNNAGTPVLIDFGLSKQYDYTGKETSTTPTGISHGYAPLEQYYQDGVRAFSPTLDTYALVATMYYLITGKVPPAATTLVENNIKFPDFVPWNIQRIISKGMSTKSTDRYLRATDFINELKHTVYGPKKESQSFESTYERPRKPSGSRQQVRPEPSHQEQPKQSRQHEQSVSPSLKRSKDPIKVTVPVKYGIFGLLALFLIELSFAINAQTKFEDVSWDTFKEIAMNDGFWSCYYDTFNKTIYGYLNEEGRKFMGREESSYLKCSNIPYDYSKNKLDINWRDKNNWPSIYGTKDYEKKQRIEDAKDFGEYIYRRIFIIYLPLYLIYFFIVRKILKVKLKRKIQNT